MGVHPRGRGRGGGNFSGRNSYGGKAVGSEQILNSSNIQSNAPPGSYSNNSFRKTSKFKFLNRGFKKFPGKNFGAKNSPAGPFVPEIDLTKPWVTELILKEDSIKQECLETWRKTKSEDDWNKYQVQKHKLCTLYSKAKGEYLAIHPHEAMIWLNQTPTKKYFCEICDKSFKSEDDLILHEEEHETCGIDGCEFTAHPNIIAKHIKMQHDSGLYKKIGKLQTEEDIAKWIEERKKRYPSRKVIEEKKALEQEKINRGERIKDDDSKFNKEFQNKNKKNRQFEKKSSKTARKKNSRKKKKVEDSSQYSQEEEKEEEATVRNGVPAFAGIKKSLEPEKPPTPEPDLNISDEEWETEVKDEINSRPLINSSLGLLATCYDSEEEVPEKECPTQNKVGEDEGSEPEEVKTVCKKGSLPEETIEEKKPCKRKENSKEQSGGKNKRFKSNDNKNIKHPRELTLLEKLLKNEIRHERNVILQCVHYIVKNNFFET